MIADDDGVWVIPISSIIAVRLIEAGAKQKGSFGFIPPTK
jgi:hypothetical protein